MFEIEYLHPDHFDWITWSGGRLLDLGIQNRPRSILSNQETIRKYAIGYVWGESLICRPKANTVAVMFLMRETDTYFWTHFTMKEFSECFSYVRGKDGKRISSI